MSKIKIVRIISRLNVGGPAIHTILLSHGLNADGYKDVLVCGQASKSEGDMMYFAKAMNIEPVCIPELGREISIGRDIVAFFKIYSMLRRERPDIVHTHTAKAGALGRLAALFAGVPIKVHTFHGHIFDGYFSPFKAKVFLLLEKFLAFFTDRIIIVSKHVKDEIVKELKITTEEKCAVIPLGLELGKFISCDKLKNTFRKQINVGADTLLVGIVGRLVPIKNHKMFLSAAIKVREALRGKNIKFVIVGDGELKDDLKRYAFDIGVSADVIFTGWIENLAPVYADLDIVVLTSLNEGTPVSLIEAMAAGLPAVATDVGGVKDIIEDGANGFLVDKNDISGLCDKILSLIFDKDARKNMGSAGRDFVRQRFSKERLIRDIERFYEDIVATKKPVI